MLTEKLLSFTLLGAEWILWLLIALSVASIGIMIERAYYFLANRLPDAAGLAVKILKGDIEGAKAAVATAPGMQAAVVREALSNTSVGADSVQEIIWSVMAREKKRYERGLAFLGTLGNNAPFIGLFGTVLGIIKAFRDLGIANSNAASKAAAGASAVMGGISEALVATAVGLAVAIPAVVAYNLFNRWMKTIVASTSELEHAIIAHLKSDNLEKKAPAQTAA